MRGRRVPPPLFASGDPWLRVPCLSQCRRSPEPSTLLSWALMNRVSQSLIALLYVNLALVALGSLCWPLSRDQGIFAWIGDVILQGGIPYQDAWDVKGILTYYTFAFSQLVFGRTLWGIRACDLIFLATTCFMLARFLRRYCEAWVVQVGVAFFALFHLLRGYWATAQPDGWATMLVMCAVSLIYLPEISSTKKRLLAGVLIGLACLYKIVFIVFLVPLGVYCMLRDRGPLDLRIENLAPVAAGAFGVVIASLLWLGAFGALGDFMQIQFDFNPAVHTRIFSWSAAGILGRLAAYLKWYLWASPLIAIGLITLWREHRDLFLALLAQLLTAFFFVVVQNKYYSYHWHPVRFTLLIFFVFGISGTWKFLRDRFAADAPPRAALVQAAMVAVLCALAFVKGPDVDRQGISARILGKGPVEEYFRGFKSYYNRSFRFLSNYRAVEYLLANSKEDESVLVWGWEPMINYMAHRRSPTRFGYNYPLVTDAKDRRELGYRSEFMEALVKDLPRYIVVGIGDRNSLMSQSSKRHLADFPRLNALMTKRYRLEKQLAGFEMWRRVDEPVRRRRRGAPALRG